jgi:hypothetical protein
MIRVFLLLLTLLVLCGCGDQPDTSALKVPRPTPEKTVEPEPPPLEPPRQRMSMDAIKVGITIVQGTQVGTLVPGGQTEFEIRLFDGTRWPGIPEAWVGDAEPKPDVVRRGKELPGKAFSFTLPLPSPISSNSRLWIRMTLPDGETASGAFKLRR